MNTPAPLPSPVPPPTPDWRRALGGVWRLTYRRFLAPKQLAILGGMFALLALLVLSALHHNQEFRLKKDFAEWSVQFYLAFVVPVIAFISAGGVVRDDMTPATVDYVLTRPLRRHAFVLYRYLAQTACLQVQCLLALGVLVAVGAYRHVPDLSETVPSLLLAQILAIPAFSALGFAFGAYTSRFLVLGIFYGGIIEVGIGNIPTQLNSLSMSHQVRTIASSVLPFRGKAAQYADSLPSAIGTLLVLTLVFAAIAAVLFSLREAAGTKPKDT